MDLKDQVCNLEQAKRLNELGIMQCISLFYGFNDGIIHFNENRVPPYSYIMHAHAFSMFTVSELYNMLPDGFISWRTEDGIWHCGDSQHNKFHMQGRTQAEAIAEELISQLEGKFQITSEEANKRLNG